MASITQNGAKFVVITTINNPDLRLLEYKALGYEPLVVGDEKTNDTAWEKFSKKNKFEYLSLEDQYRLFPKLSDIIPRNTYARKNLGYLRALQRGAKVIWETDDDTFPRSDVGDILKFLGDSKEVWEIDSDSVWNPYLEFTSGKYIWPRGFPIQNICKTPHYEKKKLSIIPDVHVLQTLVNREPDVDAIYRLTVSDKIMHFDSSKDLFALSKGTFSPANTQSTLWLKNDLIEYTYFPSTVSNRFADILKMYVAQTNCDFAFAGFLTEQFRNAHNYLDDFKQEVEMYLAVDDLIALLKTHRQAPILDIYRMLVEMGICTQLELEILTAFEEEISEILNY